MFALPFPMIDPAIVSVDLFGATFSLRWYALAYIAGLLLGWVYVVRLVRRAELWPGATPPFRPAEAEDLLTHLVVGVIVGGRLGYVLFYNPAHFLANPVEILRVWDGGMAFHGGFLGVCAGIAIFARRGGRPMLSVGDAVACATPIGLLLGRIANFINGELWGRPTTRSFGVLFPGERAQTCPPGWEGPCARHPSQLYEAALEGAVLFALLAWLAWRGGALRRPGLLTGVFLAGYGIARSVVENVRQGDAQFVTADNPWGHVIRLGTGAEAFGFTMGQVLSLPMILAGVAFILTARQR